MRHLARPALVRRALAWVALALSPALLGGHAASQPMTGPAPPLRVLSYNILHGGVLSGWAGDGQDLEARLRIAVEELRALDPDVIGVQEASVSRRRGNVAERLATALGFHSAFAPALFRLYPLEGLNRLVGWLLDFQEGPAILSRYPIVAWEAHDLPRCNGRYDPRTLVHATIRTPWGDVGIASTHTSSGFCQADRVVELMQSRQALLPSVLMGDFNAEEESAGIRRLTRQAGFVDVFRAANPAAAGLTTWQLVRAPFPTVRRRVDFVFLVPGQAVPGHVRASRVVLDAPRTRPDGTVLWPSDHYGVLAELELFGDAAAPAGARSPAGEAAGR
jgi:endonuclease/exonuclease/phosphatase family metal-dependent hydrolase